MLAIQGHRTRAFFVIFSLPATSFGLALSVQIATLSWILSTKYGSDVHDIGLVWGAGPITAIFGQIIIGGLSDRVWFWNGRRRPFISIAISRADDMGIIFIISAVATALSALAWVMVREDDGHAPTVTPAAAGH